MAILFLPAADPADVQRQQLLQFLPLLFLLLTAFSSSAWFNQSSVRK